MRHSWWNYNLCERTREMPSQDRYVGSGAARKLAGQPGIVGDFDGTLVRNETRLDVETQSAGMVGRAGMQPEALGMMLPRQRQAVLQQRAARAPADPCRRNPEE